MRVESYTHEGEGVAFVYECDNRVIGLKNYAPVNDIANLKEMERHLETDEQFMLFSGFCLLVTLREEDGPDAFEYIDLRHGIVYSVPRGVWHATVMTAGTRMVLVECSGTTYSNSPRKTLLPQQMESIRAHARMYFNRVGCQVIL